MEQKEPGVQGTTPADTEIQIPGANMWPAGLRDGEEGIGEDLIKSIQLGDVMA